jgi:hypothetical protein
MEIPIGLPQQKIDKCSRIIDRQAASRLQAFCAARREVLSQTLAFFGVPQRPELRIVEVAEDANGLLPPKIVAELRIPAAPPPPLSAPWQASPRCSERWREARKSRTRRTGFSNRRLVPSRCQ